jgi:hypothetical protein
MFATSVHCFVRRFLGISIVQQKVISGGCEIVRREVIDDHTVVVVCVSTDFYYEWGVIHNGRVAAESYMGYGDATAALRDGLMYFASGKILRESEQNVFGLARPTAFIYPAADRPLLEV